MAYNLICEVTNVNIYNEEKEWAVIVTYKNPTKKSGVYGKKQIIIPVADKKSAETTLALFPVGKGFKITVNI